MEILIPLLILLLGLSAFFSSAETAFLSLQRVQLEHAVREGESGATRIAAMLNRPARLLAGVLVGNNLVNTAAAAVGTVLAIELFGEGGSVAVATFAITILLVVFGEVGPKTVALNHSFALSRIYALPLGAWLVVTRPFLFVLDRVSRAFLAVFGGDVSSTEVLSSAEIRTAILLGAETGTLAADQTELLLGALGFRNVQSRSLMVARVDIVAVDETDTIRMASEKMAQAGYLRVPIYGDGADDVVGYVHVSDVNKALLAGRTDQPVASIARAVLFEPELASAANVLERMQASSAQMVILLDEYGSTAGLLTLEDLVEELIGEIQSESGREAVGFAATRGSRTVVDARMRLSDLEDQMGVAVDHPDAETVAGLVLEQLQHIPVRGESIEWEGYRFSVVAADERRIKLVAIEALHPVASASG
jgi:CBS domain containing-hemolysin-like protein